VLLADAGFRVLTAETYDAAQFALRTGFPDVLVVDIRLGDFNGLQLLAISASPLPAIVMTGHDDAALEREARRFGAEYFVKPITPRALIDAISRRLAAHGNV
jgi:DNA-binding NtrC family response regulator